VLNLLIQNSITPQLITRNEIQCGEEGALKYFCSPHASFGLDERPGQQDQEEGCEEGRREQTVEPKELVTLLHLDVFYYLTLSCK
jgi:hypothetical protein